MFTLQDFAIAFEKWENDYRVNPTQYLSPTQCAEMQVSELSAKCAEYFMELLTEDKE